MEVAIKREVKRSDRIKSKIERLTHWGYTSRPPLTDNKEEENAARQAAKTKDNVKQNKRNNLRAIIYQRGAVSVY